MTDLSQKETAAFCRVTIETIRRWTRAGQFPAPYKVGRRLWWRQADIEAWRRKISGQDLELTPSEAAWAASEDDALLDLAIRDAPSALQRRIERAATVYSAPISVLRAALQVAGHTLDDALKTYAAYVGPDGKATSNPNPYASWRKHAFQALGIESSVALTDPRDIDRLSRAFFDVAETIRAGMGHQANRADINRAAMQALLALTVERVITPAAGGGR